MTTATGELLIGGSRLRKLQCELEQENRDEKGTSWLLTGRISLPPGDGDSLQVARQYLLRLDDGRQALVELVKVTPVDPQHVEADFRPCTCKPR